MTSTGGSSSSARSLVGARAKRGSTDPLQVLSDARSRLSSARTWASPDARDVQSLKVHYAAICRTYYTAAAVSRRRELAPQVRQDLMAILFSFRSKIETNLLDEFKRLADQDEILKMAASGFFGASAKQGVSIRYPLSTCSPTKACGARCYAHDGRDRELHLIFRAALNGYLGSCYESGDSSLREKIFALLSPSIAKSIKAALADQQSAKEAGYKRQARIRFSHIGEMSRHSEFTNALAADITRREPQIQCVIYSRHRDSANLDRKLFVINFTIDNDRDPRRKYAPDGARLVSSAWDGNLSSFASINFLEHHVEKGSEANGEGVSCPVTASHKEKPSCDVARCQACFARVVAPPD